MNRMQLFKEMYELSTYNLLCYSQNYLMTKPKTEFVKEWKKEREKVKLLQELIAEEKQKYIKKENNIYVAEGIQNNLEDEETEELE